MHREMEEGKWERLSGMLGVAMPNAGRTARYLSVIFYILDI